MKNAKTILIAQYNLIYINIDVSKYLIYICPDLRFKGGFNINNYGKHSRNKLPLMFAPVSPL